MHSPMHSFSLIYSSACYNLLSWLNGMQILKQSIPSCVMWAEGNKFLCRSIYFNFNYSVLIISSVMVEVSSCDFKQLQAGNGAKLTQEELGKLPEERPESHRSKKSVRSKVSRVSKFSLEDGKSNIKCHLCQMRNRKYQLADKAQMKEDSLI